MEILISQDGNVIIPKNKILYIEMRECANAFKIIVAVTNESYYCVMSVSADDANKISEVVKQLQEWLEGRRVGTFNLCKPRFISYWALQDKTTGRYLKIDLELRIRDGAVSDIGEATHISNQKILNRLALEYDAEAVFVYSEWVYAQEAQ